MATVGLPWAIANGSFKRQQRNDGVTEIKKIPCAFCS
jgi:hypothetical protein